MIANDGSGIRVANVAIDGFCDKSVASDGYGVWCL